MVDPMDDIVRQARQGSVAAIIQVMNEKLADSGVRTRAMFSEGVLQLLCEAASVEQLDQPTVETEVRKILESLEPRHIRRVNINSRIAREQQLLWLEEINRDPESQLLWSKEITLNRPHLFKRLARDRSTTRPKTSKAALPKSTVSDLRAQRQFWRGLMGGACLSLLVLLGGWLSYDWWERSQSAQTTAVSDPAPDPDPVSDPASDPAPAAASQPEGVSPPPSPTTVATSPNPEPSPSPASVSPTPPTAASTEDPFAQAVRLAEEAVRGGKTAQSSAEWLELATRWQRASDLMAAVPADDSRYSTAQDRRVAYLQNSQTALQEAQTRLQTPPSP